MSSESLISPFCSMRFYQFTTSTRRTVRGIPTKGRLKSSRVPPAVHGFGHEGFSLGPGRVPRAKVGRCLSSYDTHSSAGSGRLSSYDTHPSAGSGRIYQFMTSTRRTARGVPTKGRLKSSRVPPAVHGFGHEGFSLGPGRVPRAKVGRCLSSDDTHPSEGRRALVF